MNTRESTIEKPSFIQLIDDLQKTYGVAFTNDTDKRIAGQVRALEESRTRTLEIIQDHFVEIIAYIDHKKPCIEALEKIVEGLDEQIEELRPQMRVAKGA